MDQEEIMDFEEITQFVDMISSDKKELKLEGITGLRDLLSTACDKFVIKEVVKSGIVPEIVKSLARDDWPQIQIESALIIAEIGNGDEEDVEYIVELGVLELSVQLLHSDNYEVVEQGMWIIGNTVLSNIKYRDICIEHDCIGALMKVWKKFSDLNAKKGVAWVLCNLLRRESLPEWKVIGCMLPVFVHAFLEINDASAINDAILGLTALSEKNQQEIIKTGIVPQLLDYMIHKQMGRNPSVLKIIGNLLRAPADQIAPIIEDTMLLLNLPVFLSYSNKSVQRDAIWMLRNIVASPKYIDRILSDKKIIDSFKKSVSSDPMILKEALHIVSNFIEYCNIDQMKIMIEESGCLDILTSGIKCDSLRVSKPAIQSVLKLLAKEDVIINSKVKGSDIIQAIKEKEIDKVNDNEYSNIVKDILEHYQRKESSQIKTEVNNSFKNLKNFCIINNR